MIRLAFSFSVVLMVCSLSSAQSRAKLKSPSTRSSPSNYGTLTTPMSFSTHYECAGNGCGYYILAQGVINSQTPSKFVKFLKTVDAKPTIYFNSPGGNLLAGLMLGRAIRESGLDTYVGNDYDSFEGFDSRSDEIIRKLVSKGVCYSACAYAFMGGTMRAIEDGAFGVHQFYSNGIIGESTAQVAMTVLARYIDEMGIDRRVLDIASLTLSDQIKTISPEIARELNIDNTSPPRGEWTIEVTNKGTLYAYVLQRLPGANAVVTVSLVHRRDDFLALVQYSITQKFRTSKELGEIFNSIEKPPAFCKDIYCRSEFPSRVIDDWSRDSNGVFSISLALETRTVLEMAASDEIEFHSNFPRVFSDVNPSTTFSTVNLSRVISGLLRQQ